MTYKKEQPKQYFFTLDSKVRHLGYQQVRCIFGLIENKKAFEIASELGVTLYTVKFYLKILREKFECKTGQDLKNKILSSDFLNVVKIS